VAKDDAFDPRFDPAFQPGYQAPVKAAPAKPAREESPAKVALQRRTEQAVTTTAPTAESEETHERPKPNPFLLALAAVALLLIVGGVSAVQQVRGIFAAEDIAVDLDYVSLNMLIFAAPISIALGIATGIGVLFMYAIDWRRRHQR